MSAQQSLVMCWFLLAGLCSPLSGQDKKEEQPLNVKPPHIATDKSLNYDYDIVYVRAPRFGDKKVARFAEFSKPTRMELGADLMLLHPDGSEEMLVSGQDGSVMDPYVSFDGQSVYYTKYIDAKHTGADIFKLHVSSRTIVKLTDQKFTPNTGAADWVSDFRTPEKGRSSLSYGVFNLGPCPLPGGKIAFTSNRNAHVPPRGYPQVTLQLFVMDDDGSNVEQIGWINIACALHPVILRDGRLIFSTLESHGMHNAILWGVWSIHPDGTNWAPVISAFATGGAPSGFHFQTQLSDGNLIIERYYNQNNSGFGTYFHLPEYPPKDKAPFGPGDYRDPRNKALGTDKRGFRMPYTATGMTALTPWARGDDGPSRSSISGEQVKSKVHGGKSYPHAVGKVTHPCGAPDNHLLTAWSPGPANHQYNYFPLIDSGLYLIKDGKPVDEPGKMLLIKNDPKYHEQWPRPLVPYSRVYGVDEPKQLMHKNDGSRSKHLPEGTPYGLVGTSSFYKRESAPGGIVPEGKVTSVALPRTPQGWYWSTWRTNWALQGSDAGVYDNREIHAVRVVAQEPRSDIQGRGKGRPPLYANHALERLRILGEIPLRKFRDDGSQPTDPDGNPDTSFLAKLPADQAFTFQMIDKDGMSLTASQTWHQLRPGEVRHDCGGCHAHSQMPTHFKDTAAAGPKYKIFDLTRHTPLVTDRKHDESNRKWDAANETGLRTVESGVVNVEYHRDIRPILKRSCVACHTHKSDKPAAGLVLDDDESGTEQAFGHDSGPAVRVPMTYFRLAAWKRYTQPRPGEMVTPAAASRFITKFQSRRSLLAWKIYGRRLDGWKNADFATITKVGDWKSLRGKDGKLIEGLDYDDQKAVRDYTRRYVIDNDYVGSIMPPPAAVKSGKVEPLTDEDRRTIVRWIDLGCPIDVDPAYDALDPHTRSYGWMGDDQRPTLSLTHPQPGKNPTLTRLMIGMTDAYTGLDMSSFRVTADFAIDGAQPGKNLAEKFQRGSDGVWLWRLSSPIKKLGRGTLTVSIQDRQGNVSRIEREFAVGR